MAEAQALFNFNINQKQQLQTYIDNKQYAAGYKYARDTVNAHIASNNTNLSDATRKDLEITATWLSTAADINSNAGTFKSDFVRSATAYAYKQKFGTSLSDGQFQGASNQLAESVLNKFIASNGIQSSNIVIKNDVDSAIRDLKLYNWQWAGTLGDVMPLAFGGLGAKHKLKANTYA
jgi:hypothetical protein